jgi:hypothetical protein
MTNFLKNLFKKKTHDTASEPMENEEEESTVDAERKIHKIYENGKYGFKDKQTGEVIAPAKYNFALDFSEGLAAVKLNDKWGFIDETGKVLIPFKYDDAGDFLGGLARVALNGKWGFIDKNRKEVIELKYDFVTPFFDGFAEVKLNDKECCIDKQGNEYTNKRNTKNNKE